MLTVVEKVILLQSVDVFGEATSEQLSLVAAIAKEVRVEAGEVIYRDEEPSDAMYVVAEGRVRLHRGAQDVNLVAAGEAFGTWALFDEEARVTTATAVDASLLLRIARGDFLDVLADHVEVTRAILGSISRRLRSLLGRVETRGR